MASNTEIDYSHFCPIANLDNLNEILNEHGVAVLLSVFSENECDNLIASLREYVFKEYKIATPNDYERLRPLKGGIFQNYGISLINQVLDFKTDQKAIEPFQRIWGEQELVTSLDGVFMGPPPEQTDKKKLFSKHHDTWFHTDQASNKKEFCCVQGAINLEHIEHGDGCLSVLTKSHNHHREFFETFGIDTKGRNWFLLKENHLDWYKSKGCEWKMITAPKGSMVFWDSRTIHMGTLPRADRVNKDRWRYIVYVCYAPLSWQSKDDVKLKKKAYVNNQCTSHWPYKVVLFPKREDDDKINDLRKLTNRHRKYIFGME